MKDRIREIMEAKHLTQQNFASLIGISTASLSSIFNDRTKPTLNTVGAIKNTFPDINTDWLLYGIGTMINGGQLQSAVPLTDDVKKKTQSLNDPLKVSSSIEQTPLTATGGSLSVAQATAGSLSQFSAAEGGVTSSKDERLSRRTSEPMLAFDDFSQVSSNHSREAEVPTSYGVRGMSIRQDASQQGRPVSVSSQTAKVPDRPQRKITEIRIFYDDQTWETFVPKK